MSQRKKIRLSAMAATALLTVLALCAAGHAGVRTVVDETGRHVALPENVQRIVTLAPNLTEIVYALGAEQKLVGVTSYCDYPAGARAKAKIGNPVNPSLEAIAALKPDLVLAARTMNRLETVESLDRLGIAVYATDSRTVNDVMSSIQDIANTIGVSEQGRTVVAGMRERLDALHLRLAGIAPKRVLFVIWTQPLISIGPQTFLADALRQAGAQSIVQSQQDWPEISLEEVVRLQPESLVFSANHTGTDHGADREDELAELRQRPPWKELAAVREGHVIVVGEEMDRPAPRLVDAIESLARQLHADAFAPSATANAPIARSRPSETTGGNLGTAAPGRLQPMVATVQGRAESSGAKFLGYRL
jgi:iron complex transport system substrate-binding protein